MFFVLAKVFWFLLQPSSLLVGAVIVGAALAGTAWHRLARWLLWFAVAALMIGGLSPLGDVLIRPLESRFERVDLGGGGDVFTGIIVLGGSEDNRAIGAPELAALNEAAERYTEAVALARRLPQARVIFTGGSGTLMRAERPEADVAAQLFEGLGVARDRITLESQSRDTHENALLTARIVKPGPRDRWLLVTSAWHMPRAMGCFRQAGFVVEPWPVDYRTPRRLQSTRLHTSIPEGLRRIDLVTREYVGLVMYYLAGRTDALLPGP
jgi:uncharacterized SAM-binding protein YcdF (DUF218 family)